jgi:hypothetical protein
MGTNVKKQNSDAMAAFLARGGKVAKCPAGEAKATPLRKLRQRSERAAMAGQAANVLARRGDEIVDPSAEERSYLAAENRAERMAESAAEAACYGGGCVGFDSDGYAVSRADLDW